MKNTSYKLKKPKTISDTVHGYINVSDLAMQIIDTPEFQRLSRLRQLGLTYHVFPTANHTRFEHSLGVYHITGEYLKYLFRSSFDDNVCTKPISDVCTKPISDVCTKPISDICTKPISCLSISGGAEPMSDDQKDFEAEEIEGSKAEESKINTKGGNNMDDDDKHMSNRNVDDRYISDIYNRNVDDSKCNSVNDKNVNSKNDKLINDKFNNNILRSCTERLRIFEIIKIAGLVHDIGHGVYSHLFDHEIANQLQLPAHEVRGVNILREMVNKYSIPLTDTEVELICAIISGKSLDTYPRWVFQIVNNSFFELDTDKLDYIVRDSYYTRVPATVQIQRIFRHCRISDSGDIIFDKKIYLQIYDVFMNRYRFHKEVYRHKTVIAIDLLVVEYLKLMFVIPEIKQLLVDGRWSLFCDDFINLADNLIILFNVLSDDGDDDSSNLADSCSSYNLGSCSSYNLGSCSSYNLTSSSSYNLTSSSYNLNNNLDSATKSNNSDSASNMKSKKSNGINSKWYKKNKDILHKCSLIKRNIDLRKLPVFIRKLENTRMMSERDGDDKKMGHTESKCEINKKIYNVNSDKDDKNNEDVKDGKNKTNGKDTKDKINIKPEYDYKIVTSMGFCSKKNKSND